MDIDLNKNGLTIFYNSDTNNIKKVHYNKNGYCTITSITGDIISEFQTFCSPAYNHQYGTPISPDGKYLFIGTWEKGLFCYDIQSGKVVWKQTPGKVRHIFIKDEFLIIEMGNKGIYKRDLNTGELLDEIKMNSIDFVHRISHDEIFTGFKRNKCFIYELPDLIENHTIKVSSLNINNCLSFVILDSKKNDTNLIVSGFEQFPQGDTSNENRTYFTRTIELK